MIGDPKKNDKAFEIENYEAFYEHHLFEPIREEDALNIHELIPRFGWAFDEIEQLAPKNLLDLGCLDGSFALSVARHLGVHVTGIDLTVDGVNLAKERADRYKLPAEFYQGSIEDHLERFAKEGVKFEVVTLFEIIEHVKDVQQVLRLIDGVLAPGGSVLVSTPDFEGPNFGLDDEQNTCHIRLYTIADEDYSRENKYGHVRKATSMSKEVGKDRIKSMVVHNQLINVRYE